MSRDTIAQQYVSHVKEGQFMELLDALYAEDAVSVEAMARPGSSPRTEGLEALRQKSLGFEAANEIHQSEVLGLWPHAEDRFAVHMRFDMTHRESGQRRTMDEIAIMTVRDGKICHEEFFYGM